MSFRPLIAPQLGILDTPTEEELTILRTQLDVEGRTIGVGRWVELKGDRFVFAKEAA